LYNLALEAKISAYKTGGISLSYNSLSSELKELKKEYSWLGYINSQSLQSSLRNLDTAYQNFFRTKKGFPKFKGKHKKQSFHCPQNSSIDFEKGLISLPKFREGIKANLHREFKGIVKTVTISKSPTGKYFASVLVDTKRDIPKKKPVKDKTSIGIDLGLTDFAVLSNGEKVSNPRHLKHTLVKLKYQQRMLSRKKKGSNRHNRQRLRVARLHEKVANQRANFLHQLSSEITNRFDVVCVEDLSVRNMMKNHKLAQAIGDVGWSSFVRMLEYKCEWRGKTFLQLPKFSPSTKKCCNCKSLNDELELKDRDWYCPECGKYHDRDISAAINIKLDCLEEYWRTERACQDAEASPLLLGKSKGKRAVEASISNDMLQIAS